MKEGGLLVPARVSSVTVLYYLFGRVKTCIHSHYSLTKTYTHLQKGRIHCWDLRTDKEVWVLTAPRELGYLTALTLGKKFYGFVV